MVERLVYLAAAAQVLPGWGRATRCRRWCRTAAATEQLAQGTPVQVYLAPDALRVLRGSAQGAAEEDELRVTSSPVQAAG